MKISWWRIMGGIILGAVVLLIVSVSLQSALLAGNTLMRYKPPKIAQ